MSSTIVGATSIVAVAIPECKQTGTTRLLTVLPPIFRTEFPYGQVSLDLGAPIACFSPTAPEPWLPATPVYSRPARSWPHWVFDYETTVRENPTFHYRRFPTDLRAEVRDLQGRSEPDWVTISTRSSGQEGHKAQFLQIDEWVAFGENASSPGSSRPNTIVAGFIRVVRPLDYWFVNNPLP